MRNIKNVYEIIKRDQRFSILLKILDDTGIGEAMSKEKQVFTFFAPTDDAFNDLSAETMQVLNSSKGKGLVAAILGQHIIPGKYLYSNDLQNQESVKTMHGNNLQICEKKNMLQLEDAHILTPGVAAANGVVFPIDKVLPGKRKLNYIKKK